jgi:hypothetical protein
LDTQRIQQIGQSSYQYTTLIDPSRQNGIESDVAVNCNDVNIITFLENRYYRNGEIWKTESPNVTQRANNLASPNLTANRTVCTIVANEEEDFSEISSRAGRLHRDGNYEEAIALYIQEPCSLMVCMM